MNLRGRFVAVLMVVAMLFGAGVAFAGVKAADYFQDAEGNSTDPIAELSEEELDDARQKFLNSFQNQGDFSKFARVYEAIQQNYVMDVTDDALIEGAISGMLETLDDPYSVYMDPETVEQFQGTIESSFEGIGAEVSMIDGFVTIVSPIKGSPAEKAGLKPNDQILSVDGESLEGLDLHSAVMKIRGEKGTTVTLEIQRKGVSESLSIDVVRDTISVETVYKRTEKVDGKTVGIIEIVSFSEKTAVEFERALNELETEENIDGLLIDVRGNPGGLFTVVEDIVKHFIPEDEPYVMIENRDGEKTRYFSGTKEKKDYPVSVLVNEGSASASEILAAALHEAAGYDIVGTKTFGKGTVQQTMDLGDGSNLKLTIYKWLTPNGNWIHKKGIEPTVEVKQPDFYYTNPIQLTKPLEYDMTGERVSNVQIMLDGLGYDPGRKDGYFGKKTEEAVSKFQRDYGLTVTGTVNEETARKIEQEVINAINDNHGDKQMEKALEILFQ
ncbi:S41 family peptidase [Salirhabdus salicampi]|uniref:S41 family peptidase n=1 Tax=Salirhabdus salicampi TaxID=476102 RepID=UPI0020C570BA|nr:S41 family peptidase [Salirhabdus salicampi]MCP8617619.1 S41 family peptidase [Salirhabdus salicampi]